MAYAFCRVNSSAQFRDCSKDAGFIQPVQAEAMQGFGDGLRLGLRATCPAPSARGSVLVYVPGRPVFASCDSADCPAPPHSTSLAVASHREMSGLFPTVVMKWTRPCADRRQ